MSLNITCVITVAEQKYEMDSRDMEIFVETAWVGSTGTFASLHPKTIADLITAASERSIRQAHEKLAVIKGSEALSNKNGSGKNETDDAKKSGGNGE